MPPWFDSDDHASLAHFVVAAAAARMTSELDEPMTVPSLHSLCNVNASELYPKLDLQEATLPEDVNLDVCSEPYAPVFGESIEYLSRVSDGGVLALSNYRLNIDFSSRDFLATIFYIISEFFCRTRAAVTTYLWLW